MTNFANINSIEFYAKEYHSKAIETHRIEEEMDITELLLNELPYMLENEVLSIGITGKTKSSKSTLMCWLANYISKTHYNREITINEIFADQFEFGRKVTDHDLHDCIVGIDEFGAMEETGANATIEAKHLEQFSDLQAQRNIHRIACSPRIVMDKNANLIIKIVGKDPETFTTHCLIYYRVESPSEWYTQIVGRASFNIKDIMFDEKGWKQFMEDYKQYLPDYKKHRQKEKRKLTADAFWSYILKRFRLKEFEGKNCQSKYQLEFYKKYRKRKFDKMMLMNKEGIMQMRELVFIDIILSVYKKIEGLAGLSAVNKDMIEGKIGSELKKRRFPLTIYAMEVIKSRVNSLITQKKTIERLKAELVKPKTQLLIKNKINKEIQNAKEYLNEEIKELEHLSKVAKRYNRIGEEE